MSVDDHGLEALRKSAVEITPGDKSNYQLQAKVLSQPPIVATDLDIRDLDKTIDSVTAHISTAANTVKISDGTDLLAINANGSINTLDSRFNFDGSNNLKVIDERLTINSSGQLKVVLDGKVDTGNSSTTLLLANQEFLGASTETLDYAIIFITTYSNVASATNGLHIMVSSDGITWRTGDTYTVPANKEKTFSFQPNKKYFKVNYLNGGTNQTTFDLQTVFKKTNSKPSSHRIQDEIVDDDDAELVKSVITGKKANGTYTNFAATNNGNFKISLEELENGISVNNNSQLKVTQYNSTGSELGTTANPVNIELPLGYIDTFNRIRVSDPFTRFDFTFQYDERPQLFTSLTANGGTLTYNSDKKAAILSATTTTNSETVYQTRQYFKYYPGKSNLIILTGNFKSSATNVVKQIGQFDVSNGFFFELNGSTPYVVLRSKVSGSVVDTKIAQADWNMDKLNGNGASGITINWSKQQIFVINYQWLGAGKVFYGFDINGKIYWCHAISNANVLDTLYSQTAQLPIRAAIKNTVATDSTMELTCGVLISEGGSSSVGRKYTVNSATTPRSFTLSGTRIPVITIRKKLANLACEIEVINVYGLFSINDEFLIEVVKNGTLTGASFVDVPGHIQKDVSATAITGGDIIFSTYARGDLISDVLGNHNDSTNFFIGQLLDGTSETLSLVATNMTASASAYAAINYKEIF